MGTLALVFVVLAIATGFVFHKGTALQSSPAPDSGQVVSTPTNPPAAQRPDAATTNGFAISAIKLEKTPGSSLVYATGKLRNLSDKQRYGVKLLLDLFDANGAPVGRATDFRQDMDPNGDWDFKALILDSKAVSAQFNTVLEDQ